MCMYFEQVLFCGCLHSIPNLWLPVGARVVLEQCDSHADTIVAAFRQYREEHADIDPLLIDALMPMVPPCDNTYVVPNTVTTAPILRLPMGGQPVYGDSTFGPVCQDCTRLAKSCDSEWEMFMGILKRISIRAAVGAFHNADNVPDHLLTLLPAFPSDFQALENQRVMPYVPNLRANVFRLRQWGSFRLYQLLLVHRFVKPSDATTAWCTWENDFGLTRQEWDAVDVDIAVLRDAQYHPYVPAPGGFPGPLPADDLIPDMYDHLFDQIALHLANTYIPDRIPDTVIDQIAPAYSPPDQFVVRTMVEDNNDANGNDAGNNAEA